jgi:hypothetical protein
VEPIGQLDQHHADVLGHRQEHLAHTLGPHRLLVDRALLQLLQAILLEPGHLGELGDTVYQPARLATEATLDVGQRHAAVFGHVVQERRDDRVQIQVQLGERLGDGERMRDVGVTGVARLAAVGRFRKLVGAPNGLYLGG